MASRSLNKVMLIGNLTRDPQLKYTAKNIAVCSFSIATNRVWMGGEDRNEKQESVEYHNIVAWGKLADLCSSMFHKGDKIFVEGRLQTRKWEGEDKVERRTTEVVMENTLLLKSVSDQVGSAKSSSDDEEAVDLKDVGEPSPDDFDVEDVSDDVPF